MGERNLEQVLFEFIVLAKQFRQILHSFSRKCRLVTSREHRIEANYIPVTRRVVIKQHHAVSQMQSHIIEAHALQEIVQHCPQHHFPFRESQALALQPERDGVHPKACRGIQNFQPSPSTNTAGTAEQEITMNPSMDLLGTDFNPTAVTLFHQRQHTVIEVEIEWTCQFC